jgi:UDP-N-acetylglucosamine--N-acetylmuramyl-(pentapeptide) pyrophosphoryl-undecaprenol N-acetylglucosamine transferase
VGVPAGGMHGLSPGKAARNFIKLMQGWGTAYRLGRRERPAVLFATGGYASIPVALAAWTLRVPILVYLPDIEPGLAVRLISRLASRVAVTVEDSVAYFSPPLSPPRGGRNRRTESETSLPRGGGNRRTESETSLPRDGGNRRTESETSPPLGGTEGGGKVVVTGYPVRAEFHGIERAEARDALDLALDEPVLLVMGGSRGARSINEALSGVLEQILELAQVVHVSGELDWSWVVERRETLSEPLKARYQTLPYLHQIELGLAAADLAVCRAGAMTLGELPFFGLPAVLVPYPHAWRYQRVNAEWLAGRGAALVLDDERLAEELLPTVRDLLSDRERLAQMGERARALARPDAAARLAAELQALATRRA